MALTTFSKCHVTYAKKVVLDAGLQADSNDKLGLAFDSTLPPECNIAVPAENMHALHIFPDGSKSDSNVGN